MIRQSEKLLTWAPCFLAALAVAGTAIGPQKVPDDFPKDFPIYQDAIVRSYGPMVPLNPGLGNLLVLQTPDPKAAVLEFYRAQLPLQGWSVEKPYTEAPDTMGAHKDNRRISVSVLESEAGGKRSTLIQLGVNSTE